MSRFADVLFEAVRPYLVQGELLLYLVQCEPACLLAVFVSAHSIGNQQIEKSLLGGLDIHRNGVVAKEQPAHGEGIFIILAHKALVAYGIDVQFHSTVKSRVAMRTRSPFFNSYCSAVASLRPLMKVPLVEPRSEIFHPPE